MHYIHCILVKLNTVVDPDQIVPENYESIKRDARELAMNDTECYGDGDVFDWRTDEDAGRWIDMYPGIGVILGAEDPERFMKELDDFREKPIQHALERITFAKYDRIGWRNKEQIAQEGAVIMPNPRNDLDGSGEYFSGVLKLEPVINEDYLKEVWSRGDFDMESWYYKTALAMACGDYKSDSNFYSLPDYSTKLSPETLQDVRENPGQYALVFSDYHN